MVLDEEIWKWHRENAKDTEMTIYKSRGEVFQPTLLPVCSQNGKEMCSYSCSWFLNHCGLKWCFDLKPKWTPVDCIRVYTAKTADTPPAQWLCQMCHCGSSRCPFQSLEIYMQERPKLPEILGLHKLSSYWLQSLYTSHYLPSMPPFISPFISSSVPPFIPLFIILTSLSPFSFLPSRSALG